MKSGKRFLKRKKVSIIPIIIIIIITILLSGVLILKTFGDKFGQINYKEIDKSDLAMNDGIYNLVSGTLSTNEFNNVKNILLLGIDSEDSDR